MCSVSAAILAATFAPQTSPTHDIHFSPLFIEPFRISALCGVSRPCARVFLNPSYSFARINALMRQVKA
jgi:hypothetical protein